MSVGFRDGFERQDDLIRRFGEQMILRPYPIRSELDLWVAESALESLNRSRSYGGNTRNLTSFLCLLVANFNDMKKPSHDGEMLLMLMDSWKLSQIQLSRFTQILPSTISSVLGNTRTLNRSQIHAVSLAFNVSSEFFYWY